MVVERSEPKYIFPRLSKLQDQVMLVLSPYHLDTDCDTSYV